MKIKNRKVITNISRKTLRENGKKYVIAILAIILTATLFTTLFTVGGSMLSTIQAATMRQVGTRAHAGFKFLTREQYDMIASDPEVKDISYDIIVGIAENPELAKTYTEIRYTEEKNAEWNFCMPTTGTLPAEKYDLATTTNVLDALGVPHRLGETVTLLFTANGIVYEQEFTLCGFWEDSIAFGANEAYVSREYCDEVAPVLTVPIYERAENGDELGVDSYAGGINPSIWFDSSWDIENKVMQLKERLGFDSRVNEGINWAYAVSSVDAFTVFLIAGMLLLILLSCYLIIYNIFSISVARDIRFYGLLKTIGTTGKQLKRVVRSIAIRLSAIGIPIGLFIGFLIGWALMPVIIRSTTIPIAYELNCNPVIFAAGAVFTLLTVVLSCERPCRIAAGVSPIEAVRWTGVVGKCSRKYKKIHREIKKKERTRMERTEVQKFSRPVTPFSMALAGVKKDKRKAVTVILSITLSLILFNSTYALVKGFDMEKYLKEEIVTDFCITDNSIMNGWNQERILDGISKETIEEIRSLPGLEREGAVWCSILDHKFSDAAYERALKIVKENRDELPMPYAEQDLKQLQENAEMSSFVYGVDEDLWEKLELAKRQRIDIEKFATGDYIIVSGFWVGGEQPYYLPGEEVTIDFGNGSSKTYTVLANGSLPYAVSQRFSYMLDIRFILPAEEYAKQVGESGALCVAFDIADDHLADTEEWCGHYTEHINPELAYESRPTLAEEFQGSKMMYAIIGGILAGILALIGVLNFTNTVLMSVDARKRELAILQSVGMTGRQVKRMLTEEGLLYAGGSLALALAVGNLITYGIIRLLSREMWFLTWHFSMLPVLACAPALLLIGIAVPMASYRSMCRQTVVERLRETE